MCVRILYIWEFILLDHFFYCQKSCFLLCYHVFIVFYCIFLLFFNLIKITQPQFDWDEFESQWKNMIFENCSKRSYLFLQMNSSYIYTLYESINMILSPGTPRITSLTKHRSNDGKHKVLTCEAEGSPKPDVQWSVNGTNVSHYHTR